MNAQELAETLPRLYHMAEIGAWPSIQRHGLLSTTALLDYYEIEARLRDALEARRRPERVTIRHPKYGPAVLLDQKAIIDRVLSRCLRDSLTPADWYRVLNAKVFFWPSRKRLEKMLNARAYRPLRHTVLEIHTERLLARYADDVLLSSINSGSTIMAPQPRGTNTFLPITAFPYERLRKKRRRSDVIAELAIRGGVPDIDDYIVGVTEEGAGKPVTTLVTR